MFSVSYRPNICIQIIFSLHEINLATSIKDHKIYTVIWNNFSPSTVPCLDVSCYCTCQSNTNAWIVLCCWKFLWTFTVLGLVYNFVHVRSCCSSHVKIGLSLNILDTNFGFMLCVICEYQQNIIDRRIDSLHPINLVNPSGYVMHQQFNIQQLYVLPTLYLCVLYLSENKQRLVPLNSINWLVFITRWKVFTARYELGL